MFPTTSLDSASVQHPTGRHSFTNASTTTQKEIKPSPTHSLQNMSAATAAAGLKQQSAVQNPILPSKFPKESLDSLLTSQASLKQNIEAVYSAGTNQASTVLRECSVDDAFALQPPKRTVFSSTSSKDYRLSRVAPPDYSSQISEIMQAVKRQESQETPGANMKTSLSQGLNQKASVKSTSSMGLTEQKQAIMQKYNEPNKNVNNQNLSPMHHLAGDLSARNPNALALSATGKRYYYITVRNFN